MWPRHGESPKIEQDRSLSKTTKPGVPFDQGLATSSAVPRLGEEVAMTARCGRPAVGARA